MTYGNHGVVTFYTRMAAASLRRYAVSSRMHTVYSRIYMVGSQLFTDISGGFANIRDFYMGFAEALRLRYRRCVDGSGTAEGDGNLRFGQSHRTAAVVYTSILLFCCHV